MSRRSKTEKKCFKLIFIDVLEVNFYERISPKWIKDHLIRKARRQQINDQMGPITLTVHEDHLELNKCLWWPNTGGKFLAHTQLRDVFPLELDAKKFAIGIARMDTRDRRILVFKAKSNGECQQVTNLLDDYRKFQQTYEAEIVRSVSRELDPEGGVRNQKLAPCRKLSVGSFVRNVSVTDYPEPVSHFESRRSRRQSVDRVSFTPNEDTVQRKHSIAGVQYHAEPDVDVPVTRMRPARLCRTPIHQQTEQYERAASALPNDAVHNIIVGRPTSRPASRPSRMNRTVLNSGLCRQTPTLPNYVHPLSLQRSTSAQALPVYPNKVNSGNVGDGDSRERLFSTYENPVGMYDVYRNQSERDNANHITFQNSPNKISEPRTRVSISGASGRSHSRTQSTSPNLPPEYEALLYRERNLPIQNCTQECDNRHLNLYTATQNYGYRQQSESGQDVSPCTRSNWPITIVRETDSYVNDPPASMPSQRSENEIIEYFPSQSPSLPPLPSTAQTGTLRHVFHHSDHASFNATPNRDDEAFGNQVIFRPPESQSRLYSTEVIVPPRPQLWEMKVPTYGNDKLRTSSTETKFDSDDVVNGLNFTRIQPTTEYNGKHVPNR